MAAKYILPIFLLVSLGLRADVLDTAIETLHSEGRDYFSQEKIDQIIAESGTILESKEKDPATLAEQFTVLVKLSLLDPERHGGWPIRAWHLDHETLNPLYEILLTNYTEQKTPMKAYVLLWVALAKCDFEFAEKMKVVAMEDAFLASELEANYESKFIFALKFRFQMGIQDETRYPAYIEQLKQHAGTGDEEIQEILQKIYEEGKFGVTPDIIEARKWALRAEGMDEEGMLELAGLYLQQKNYKEVLYWYQKAANQGSVEAMHELGLMYADGNVIEKNEKTAFKWFLEAAKRDYMPSAYAVGVYYEYGRGEVVVDFEKAAKWYKAVIRDGDDHTSASARMGHMIYDGRLEGLSFMDAAGYFMFVQDGHSRLYWWLSFRRAGGTTDEFDEALEQMQMPEIDSAAYLHDIMRFFRGDLNEGDLIARAKAHSSKSLERLCEIYFYVGSFYLVEGKHEHARSYFLKCISTGMKDHTEYISAEAQLKQYAAMGMGESK